jgi:uncharacterized membrane protein YfcA
LKAVDLSTLLGYGISGLMGIVGVLVLTGVLAKEGTPVQFRILFGIVLILYSVYRFTMTRARRKQEEGSEE